MDRRTFLKLTGAGAAAGLVRSASPQAAPAQADQADQTDPKRPNVVLIISDDQAWTDYGFMGHKVVRTPRLDRLALQSLVLTRGYVPTALCRPSLATICTGLYPHRHGTVGNDPNGGAGNLAGREQMIAQFEKLPTLPRLLGRAGYVSFQSGKWWEGNPARGGFTAGMTHGDPKRGGRHGDAGLTIGRQGLKPILDFIDGATKDRKPFFLWYAPFLPHQPHNPPQRLLDKYAAADRPLAIAKYYAMCEWFDETCGELLDGLQERGLTGNTLVVYVCDNGWVQWAGKSPGFEALRSKRTAYERGVRTPIMVRWPGHVTPRRDETTLASSIDIAPTVLAACGLKPTADMPGLDLLDADATAKRKAIFGASFEHNIADLSNPASGLRRRWGIEGRWKLLLPNPARLPGEKPRLFDLLADPHEEKDLAAEQPDKVKHLTALINQWWPAK